MSVRYLGRGIEDALRDEYRKVLAGDQEALRLALRLLDAYAKEGRAGVRRIIKELLEEDSVGSEAEEA